MLLQFFAKVFPFATPTPRELSFETFVKELSEFDPKSFETFPATDPEHLKVLRLHTDVSLSDIEQAISHIEQTFDVKLLVNHKRVIRSRAIALETFYDFAYRARQLEARLAS